MILILTSLLSLVLLVNGQSRYFIGNYTLPIVGTSVVPYPLDLCVNYEVELKDFTSSVNKFGIFTCNQANDQVTFTDYGASDNCSASPVSTVNYTDNTITAGERYSFNCVGQDNYVITDACTADTKNPPPATGGAICCEDGCLGNAVATDVCFNDGKEYRMAYCDYIGSTTYNYSAKGCDPSKLGKIKGGSTLALCKYATTQLIYDVFLRMSKCVENGTDVTDVDYCPYIETSSNPTLAPSGAPTGYTSPPTTFDESSCIVYYVRNVIALMMVISIWMV